MGSTILRWESKTAPGTFHDTDLGAHPCLQRFRGWFADDGARAVSKGGKAVTVTHDTWFECDVVRKWLLASDTDRFADVSAWLSHAQSGGEFAFKLDADEDAETTLDAAEAVGQTVISVTSTTGFGADEEVILVDAADPTVYQWNEISSIGSGEITLKRAIDHAFADGSTFRHAWYLPACVLVDDPRFELRDAGRGNWRDLSFRFRTVR